MPSTGSGDPTASSIAASNRLAQTASSNTAFADAAIPIKKRFTYLEQTDVRALTVLLSGVLYYFVDNVLVLPHDPQK